MDAPGDSEYVGHARDSLFGPRGWAVVQKYVCNAIDERCRSETRPMDCADRRAPCPVDTRSGIDTTVVHRAGHAAESLHLSRYLAGLFY